MTESEEREKVDALLIGAIDLHCHSGPAAMPRTLDHFEAMTEAEEAGFRAILFKDHFYLGTPQAILLQTMNPSVKIQLFSGIALNNASGGFNPFAVDHAVSIGAKIVWLPTLSAENHLSHAALVAKSFPATTRKMLDPEPLTGLDANGNIDDGLKKILDIIAEGDIILSGGHLTAHELIVIFEEARKRGVKKMMVNHPTYIVDCTEDDMRALVEIGAYLEHSLCMFTDGKVKRFEPSDLRQYIDIAGVDRTILGSDLGMLGNPRPVAGFRQIVKILLDLQFSDADIRTLVGNNAAGLLDL